MKKEYNAPELEYIDLIGPAIMAGPTIGGEGSTHEEDDPFDD